MTNVGITDAYRKVRDLQGTVVKESEKKGLTSNVMVVSKRKSQDANYK